MLVVLVVVFKPLMWPSGSPDWFLEALVALFLMATLAQDWLWWKQHKASSTLPLPKG